MLTEAGVKVLYHTDFLRPVLEGETITGVLVGVLVYQEVMGIRTAVGSVLVILAGLLIVFADLRQQKKADG